MNKPLIVCCSPDYGDGWRELGPSLTGEAAEWVYYDDRPTWFLERLVRRPNVAIIRASLLAVSRAMRKRTKLMVTQEPRTTLLCALFCRIFRVKIDHYVFSFNLTELPTGLWLHLMRYSLKQVWQFTVHSAMERDLYSTYLRIPKERIHLRLWSLGEPKVSPLVPLHAGRYVSSVGGNGRDYPTLIEAARSLPNIPFVLVARPDNLPDGPIPANVKTLLNMPFEQAMNILKYSAFTVLPLAGASVPCGHVTLVCAMHLGKAVVATESTGILDYVIPGHNGVLCKPISPTELANSIEQLWNDPAETARLSENNRQFGLDHCTESRARYDLANILRICGIPPDAHDLVTAVEASSPQEAGVRSTVATSQCRA